MVFSGVAIYFGIPETYRMTLEEVAEQFGDEVMAGKMEDIVVTEKGTREDIEHVEEANAAV